MLPFAEKHITFVSLRLKLGPKVAVAQSWL